MTRYQKNLVWSLSLLLRLNCKNARPISTMIPTGYSWNRSCVAKISGSKFGPISRASFRDGAWSSREDPSKQSYIWFSLVFPSLQHDGVGRTHLLFPLQKERFPLAFSLCGPTCDRDKQTVKQHSSPISAPPSETVSQHCDDCSLE